MTKKVKVTQKQYKALEYQKKQSKYFSHERVICAHIQSSADWDGGFEGLNNMPLIILIDALRIGYEIEPVYKAGDWVVYDGLDSYPAVKISAIQHLYERVRFDHVSNWRKIRDIMRHATPEEIAEEKERQLWESIGREVGEFKVGDAFKYEDGDWDVVVNESCIDLALRRYNSGVLVGILPAESFISFKEVEPNATTHN